MSIEKTAFGKMPDGTQVDRYTLANTHGLAIKIITYGATLTAVEMPDRLLHPGTHVGAAALRHGAVATGIQVVDGAGERVIAHVHRLQRLLHAVVR